MQSPQGDGNTNMFHRTVKYMNNLRNAVPARGRKRWVPWRKEQRSLSFEKCSPRKGTETCRDHLLSGWVLHYLRNAVPARGRKLLLKFYKNCVTIFEKCSPRKGTETRIRYLHTAHRKLFEKCSPRKGTETRIKYLHTAHRKLFEKCSPRKGTETDFVLLSAIDFSHLRNAVPARGRKQVNCLLREKFHKI